MSEMEEARREGERRAHENEFNYEERNTQDWNEIFEAEEEREEEKEKTELYYDYFQRSFHCTSF